MTSQMRQGDMRRRSGHCGAAALVIILVVAVLTQLALAQGDRVTRGQAEERLEQAEEAFRRLAGIFTEDATGDVQLNDRIEVARRLIDGSQEALHGNRYGQSYRLSSEALDLLRKVAKEMQRLETRRQFSNRLLEQVRDDLEILRLRAQLQSPDEKTARMLDVAMDTFHRAIAAGHDGKWLLAYKLLEQAETLVRKIKKELVHRAVSGEFLSRELDHTDEILEHMQEALAENGSPEAHAVLERAGNLQTQAREANDAGHFEVSHRLTLKARTLARLGLRLEEHEPANEAERILIHTDQLIEQYEERIRDAGDEQAIGLLEDAMVLQSDAWDSYSAGNADEGLAKTRAAAKLVNAAQIRIARPAE